MEKNQQLYVTKNATFDVEKVNAFHQLRNHFEHIEVSSPLQQLLQGQAEWEIQCDLDDDLQIERQPLLECMVTNYCTSINFKYFWEYKFPLLLHIQFRNLKELIFSVDSDHGYLTSIEFLTKIDAPNLVNLDLSNMEDGCYSLRSLRKCYFPKLEVLNLQNYYYLFKDYQACTQGYFPLFKEFKQSYYNPVRNSNAWRAKMQSPLIREQYEA